MAHLLADMVPGATIIRVTQRAPGLSWPSAHARAYDHEGNGLPMTRAQRVSAARWVIRTYQGVDWTEPHDLDLPSGTLRPLVQYAHGTGGE
ncbi:hypothetical protein [Streptomyces sp. NPDC048172]|uniref:hypothetical protein n=1 Tax=Streptomyces sp. NPDC048172 TaxID=3365505 RepID=UPI00371D5743